MRSTFNAFFKSAELAKPSLPLPVNTLYSYVCSEVAIGSKDSIELAIAALQKEKLSVPKSVLEIKEMFDETPSDARDQRFYDHLQELIKRSKAELKELLSV